LQQRYRQLLNATSWVVGQAKRFCAEIARGVWRRKLLFRFSF